MKSNVAVLGASCNPERYSYQAVLTLSEQGYAVFPVHPSGRAIEGITCYQSLGLIPEPLDTVTVYLSEKNSTPLIEDIIAINPRRVIINPGAENPELEERCRTAAIHVQKACTLLLLRTGQFESPSSQ